MVCDAAILSSTLALGLLKNAAPPNSSFVLSPFSLGSALSILHDGAGGNTQKELTNLLLNGGSPDDVTAHYTSLTKALFKQNSHVTIKTANRFYINKNFSLLPEYQKSVKTNYHADVLIADFSNEEVAAQDINAFIEGATNGKIKDMIESDEISADGREYSFFVVLPQPGTTLSQLKENLDGVKLNEMLSGSRSTYVNFEMPNFKLESELDGVEVLRKMGVNDLFTDANLSKVSSTPLTVFVIKHKAMIEVNERGTEAAAATVVQMLFGSSQFRQEPLTIIINRPAIYGIVRTADNDVMFIGQIA